ncbi:uncharacterized protein RJT21DRAFT_121512 [Scheffersomyces amazonensis]|uniref:uncharacterized protein n=1 Tax=Scheffersomyces amazonensis TaxID=1078765 RepID=UPI00315D0D65
MVSDSSIDLWFNSDNFRDVEQKNVYPNVSVFNRSVYTVIQPKEVYIKYSKINASLGSLDEIAFLSPKCCFFRISENRYIEIVRSSTGNEIAVLGELSEKFITKNDFNQYDSNIYEPQEQNIVSLDKIYDPSTLTADALIDAATSRVRGQFGKYIKEVRGQDTRVEV